MEKSGKFREKFQGDPRVSWVSWFITHTFFGFMIDDYKLQIVINLMGLLAKLSVGGGSRCWWRWWPKSWIMTKFGPRGHTPSHNSDWLDMLLIVLVTHRCMCILMSYKTVLMLGSFPTLVLSSPLFGQAPSAYARNLCCMSNYWTYNVPPRQLSWSITTITRVYDQFILGISRVNGFINQLIL